MNKKKVGIDFVFTIGATAILNGVLQCLVYPYINTTLGKDAFGQITFYMSIVTIIGTAIGTAACNNRLAINNKMIYTNGDFLRFLCIFIPVGTIVGAIIFSFYAPITDILLLSVLIVLTCIRFYGCVQYRIELQFKRYFLYFFICTLGYLFGIFVFRFTNIWELVFIIGELASCIFLFLSGKTMKYDSLSENSNDVLRTTITLLVSLAIYELTVNADRIVLLNFDSAHSVTIYYSVSTIPKVLFILSGPINNIVLSYTSKNKLLLSKRIFIKLVGIYALLVSAFYVITIFATPLFMSVFYSSVYNESNQYFLSISLIIIIDLFCSTTANLIFAEFGSKYHLYIYASFIIYYLPLTIVFTLFHGLTGYIIGAIVSEVIKLLIILILGIYMFNKKRKSIGG